MSRARIRVRNLTGSALACLLLQGLVTSAAVGDAHLEAQSPPPPDGAAILGIMERDAIVGLAAAVVDADGVVWQGTYGLADVARQAPVRPDTTFLLASVSKVIVATAVMQLYERGLIDLDADIDTYLRFSLRHPAHPDVPITPRMLLTHRGGLAQPFPIVPDYFRTYPGDTAPPLYPWILDYLLPEGVDYRPAMWLESAPGEVSSYSNMGATVLGYLVEVITGQDFGDYCTENIFAPLDMPRTGFRLADVDLAQLASLYFLGEPIEQYSVRGYPATMLRSSLEEFSHFLVAILNDGVYAGERILESQTVDLMLRIAVPERGLALIWSSSGSGWMGHGGNFQGVTARFDVNRKRGRALLLFTNVTLGGAVQPQGDLYERVRVYAAPEPSAELAGAVALASLLILGRRRPCGRRGPERAGSSIATAR